MVASRLSADILVALVDFAKWITHDTVGVARRREVELLKLRRLIKGAKFLSASAAVLAALGAAGIPVYVHPQIDQLRHADAIFILGGEGWQRYPTGMKLAREGWADTVVESLASPSQDPSMMQRCLRPRPDLTMVCVVPTPPTTEGEARELHRLAQVHGWRTVIVVTFRPHISRARFILERCFSGNLIMVESPANLSMPQWAYQYLRQTAGYIKAVFLRPC